jgi:uncharacterized membrane protein YdbT with pleckstrin-like domain
MTADQPPQDNDTSSNTNQRSDKKTESANDNVILQTSPTLRPTLILMVTVILIAGVLIGLTNTVIFDLIENQTIIEIISAAILVLMVLALIRLIIRTIVLRRTSYIIRPNTLERETDLIHQYTSRKAPVDELRGFEYSQNAFQRLLGYGSVRLLTGGTDQSLGFIVFKDLARPDQTRTYLDNLISD